MFMNIDPANGLAIYDQIVRQIKFAVANESVAPGDLVPSVRELARDLTINHNTVARAYRELQSQGILAPVRGTGLEITPQAPKRCQQDRIGLIRARLRSVLDEARQSQLEAGEIRELVEEELVRLDGKGKSK
jgi:GntR family transcriptional regulator